MAEGIRAAGPRSSVFGLRRQALPAWTAAPAAVRIAALGLILPLAILGLWHYAAASGWAEPSILPAPAVVWNTGLRLYAEENLLGHIAVTSERVLWGFLLGTAAATVLGALAGAFQTVHRILDPTMQALRSIPSIAWVPLFVLWFGIFETPKILLIAVGVAFPVYLALVDAIRQVDRKLVEVARVSGLSFPATILRVLIPAALPTYLTGLRGGLGLGWMFVVAAELTGSMSGLGYLMIDGQQTGRPDIIIVSILLFAVLGKLSDVVLGIAARRLTRWQDSFKPSRRRA